jgi:TetR/AcrR family fatty acid metabolism transcriptional regulator
MKKEGDKFFRILDAAVKVFARKGFFKARIRDIAKEAGVADGTVYLYFKNKDDILIQVFEVNLDSLLQALQAYLLRMDHPIEKLKGWFQFQVGFLKENKGLAEVLIVEIRQSHRFMKEYVPRYFFSYLDILGGILREGQEIGVFVEYIDVDILKYAIYGGVEEVAHKWILKSEGVDLERALQGLCRVWLEGMAKKKAEVPV